MADQTFRRADLVRSIWARGREDFAAGRDRFWVTSAAALLGAFWGGAVTPTSSATPIEKGGLLGLGVALGAIVGLILCLAWHTARAAFSQRDGLRIQVNALEAEIASRDRIEFSIEKSMENIGDYTRIGNKAYSNRSVLYVAVENLGVEAEFSARFLHLQGARQVPEDFDTEEYQGDVAWENTPDKRRRIGYRERERLVIISAFGDPPSTFWFNVPFGAFWDKGGTPPSIHHGWILEAVTNTVEFDLTVINLTHNQAIDKHAVVNFLDDGTVESFEFRDG